MRGFGTDRGVQKPQSLADVICERSLWCLAGEIVVRVVVEITADFEEWPAKEKIVGEIIQGSAKRLQPGCVNAAGKFRQEW